MGIVLLMSSACTNGAPVNSDAPSGAQTDVPATPSQGPESKLPAIGADDRCITPEGAGKMDGTNWENAFKGNTANAFQAAWDSTGETGTLFIGSGEYTVGQTIQLANGGKSADERREIEGVDTGSGLPVLKGSYDAKATGFDVGEYFIHVQSGASYWAVKNIDIMNYRAAVYAEGKNVGYHIDNVNITNTRDGFYLKGGGTKEDPDGASHDILIENCDVKNNNFRGFRFMTGNYNVKIVKCTVDAGGKENYVDGAWPFGFQIAADGDNQGVYEHDFELTDCISNNNYMEIKGGYWNGDGFVAEWMAKNLKYIRCTALNNTDGGWDDKSPNPVLEDCVGINNKRNFRFWSDYKLGDHATMINCMSAYAQCKESDAEDAGVWVSQRSALEAYNCTFYNNHLSQVMPETTQSKIKLVNCIIATDDGVENPLYYLDKIEAITLENSAEYIKGVRGEDPQIKNPIKEWDAVGDNFNSVLYGKEKGFYRE
jgi:hypothetical protein